MSRGEREGGLNLFDDYIFFDFEKDAAKKYFFYR